MLISQASAMRIVMEVSSVIHHDVNMMDERGVIIASTNPARTGTVHGGALKILQEGLDELIVEKDGEYEGARPGVNLPLLFEGRTVGVIGLTGRREDVAQYGRIIKKMTEILLLDSWAERQKQLKAAVWSQFIEEWLFSPSERCDEAFIERGLQLGVDIREPRAVLIVALTDEDKTQGAAQERLVRLERELHGIIRSQNGGFYYKLPYRCVCFVAPCETEKLNELAEQIAAAAQTAGLCACVGIDAAGSALHGIRASYARAEKALRAAIRSEKRVHFYNGADLEILAGELPAEVRRNFLDELFRGCRETMRDKICDFLTVYFDKRGSVHETAEALFVHKNTVQYKLHKIARLTGHDPRDLRGAAVLQTALAVRATLREDAVSVLKL